MGWGLLVREELPDVALLEALDLDEALVAVRAVGWPDLIALDVSGRGSAAVDRVRHCRAYWPRVPLVVLVDHDAPTVLPPLMSEGIDGVVARTAQPAAIAQLIRVLLDARLSRDHIGLPTAGAIRWNALAPESLLRPDLSPDFSGPPAPEPSNAVPSDLSAAVRAELAQLGLSPRQLDVLRLLATGQSNKQIGRELGVAESTIKTHVLGLFQKLGVMSRTEAMLWAGARGLGLPAPPAAAGEMDGWRG